MTEQGDDVSDHDRARIGGRVMGLRALTVAAAIERDAADALALERAVPAEPLPVLFPVRRKAMHQHDRATFAWTDVVIGNRHAAGVELRHQRSTIRITSLLEPFGAATSTIRSGTSSYSRRNALEITA